MSIIEYMNYFRKDESSPFFIDENPNTFLETYIDSGDITVSEHISNDQLIKTVITKYKTLECFNQIVNQLGITTKNLNFEFNKVYGAPKVSHTDAYKLLGITQPFRLTTTYTFPTNSVYQSIFFKNVENSLITDARFELHGVELIENNQTITLIERFKDSTEFNSIRFSDGYWIPQLHKMNVSKQVNYELI